MLCCMHRYICACIDVCKYFYLHNQSYNYLIFKFKYPIKSNSGLIMPQTKQKLEF